MSITFARFSKSGMAKDQQIMRSCKVWKSRDKLELNQLFSSWWCSDSSPFSQKSPFVLWQNLWGKNTPINLKLSMSQWKKKYWGSIGSWFLNVTKPTILGVHAAPWASYPDAAGAMHLGLWVSWWLERFYLFLFFFGGVDIWTCRSYQLTNIWGSICKAISSWFCTQLGKTNSSNLKMEPGRSMLRLWVACTREMFWNLSKFIACAKNVSFQLC